MSSFSFYALPSTHTRLSKMRSDSIVANDPRASVLVAPPGEVSKAPEVNGNNHSSRPNGQRWQRGGRRGRGRRGGGADNSGGAGMEVD